MEKLPNKNQHGVSIKSFCVEQILTIKDQQIIVEQDEFDETIME